MKYSIHKNALYLVHHLQQKPLNLLFLSAEPIRRIDYYLTNLYNIVTCLTQLPEGVI